VLTHGFVIDACSAYLRFQGPEPAVSATDALPDVWDHSVTCHPIQVNPSLPYIGVDGQISSYYCRYLPSGETGTNLYCVVNRGTRV